eukprot:3236877-Pyramimonas_sp.AAC.2
MPSFGLSCFITSARVNTLLVVSPASLQCATWLDAIPIPRTAAPSAPHVRSELSPRDSEAPEEA